MLHVPLSIFAEIPSGTLTKDSSISYTLTSVHKKSTGHVQLYQGSSYMLERGGWQWVRAKLSKKYTIENRSLVRVFSYMYSVFLTRSGMETSFLLGVRGIKIPEEMTFGFSYLFYNSAINWKARWKCLKKLFLLLWTWILVQQEVYTLLIDWYSWTLQEWTFAGVTENKTEIRDKQRSIPTI